LRCIAARIRMQRSAAPVKFSLQFLHVHPGPARQIENSEGVRHFPAYYGMGMPMKANSIL
jgi:hypothetical protein